jgi:CTP-dependent riboflavin kinase
MLGESLTGDVAAGIGQGQHFTQLGWARAQFIDRLGIEPFPGTLNLIVHHPLSISIWNRLKDTPGIRIENPNNGPHDCDARCYLVSINGQIDAAIVYPEVSGYPPEQIEIIAAIGIRDTLDIADGDSLSLEIQ